MKKYKCNADCPDVDHGKCCRPENCIKKLKSGVEIIATERNRQIEELGYDYTNDALYADEQLAKAAVVYAMTIETRELWWGNQWFSLINRFWPWNLKYWKPTPEDRIKELSKAGALIASQIDYLQNKN